MPTVPVNFAFSEGGSVDLPTGDDLLTIESAQDTISFSGSFTLTRDQRGLALAQAVLTVLKGSVEQMQSDLAAGRLPETLVLEKPTERDNPFSGS